MNTRELIYIYIYNMTLLPATPAPQMSAAQRLEGEHGEGPQRVGDLLGPTALHEVPCELQEVLEAWR